MRILFVAMSDSIHTARWINQIADREWDLHLFSSVDYGVLHPEMRNITEDTIPFSGKFCVVDGQQLMMGLSDPEVRSTQEMMFWSKSQYTAKNMIEPLFNMVWEKSSPFSTKKAN